METGGGGKIAASDRFRESSVTKWRWFQFALFRISRLIFHRSIIKYIRINLTRFHTIWFSLESSSLTNSITISSIPEEKIQFPSSPIDPRKNLVFPIRTFNFLLYPKNAALVWTFYDPQTDLTEQSNEPKTASFLSTFTLTPDYELPKAPARHNHLLDHKLSPLSPCFLPLRLLSTTRNASSSSDRYPEREGWAG